MPSNQWGPYYPGTNGGNVPTPTGVQNPPQSPSGSVTNAAATWNANAGETSTQYYLDSVLNVDSAQQGVAASNVAVKLAGVDPAAIQQNNWYSGSYGTTGNKFS